MAKIKIKTKDEKVMGKNICFPLAGTVLVPIDGIIEVDESHAEVIVNGGIGWSYAEDTAGDNSGNNNGGDGAGNEEPVTIEQLEALTLDELVVMAKGAGIKQKEYVKIIRDRDKMIKFLFDKFNA